MLCNTDPAMGDSLMKTLLAIALVCTPWATNAQPAKSVWDGTYKLDYGKSHITGDPITYAKADNSSWRVTTGQGTYTFVPDGKPHPLFDAEHTQTATMTDDHSLVIVMRAKDTIVTTMDETLSSDGKTLTNVTTRRNADGSPYAATETFTRVGPGNSFFATWTSTSLRITSSVPALLTISTTADGIVTWSYSGKSFLTGKPDGTPLPVTGPGINPGRTISFKTISERRMDFVTATQGKTDTVGYYQLSDDGKTLDDVYWDPADPSAKDDKVYIRQ
jgi:hypothetical protein